MNCCILSCTSLLDFVKAAQASQGTDYPVFTLDRALHNEPSEMKKAACDTIASLPREYDTVLVSMGFCGGVWHETRFDRTLVIPRVDDCISLLLGSVQRRLAVSREHAAYFFTEGWLRGERNIWVEHLHMLELYGAELTEELEKDMFGHYKTLGLLDCGIKPVQPLVEGTKMIADGLHLTQQVIPASTQYLCDLLTGPWPPERFLTLRAGQTIGEEDLTLPED